ncbi:MAG: hypothetical protein IBJ11_11255 [Phycisphaerales bacterium]|nr:hypothetical protein [Phycisphaerales bacterium]
MSMRVGVAALAAAVVGVPAWAGTVALNVDESQIAGVGEAVVDARYRVSNTNWDQMISTSSNVSVSTLVQTANLGNHDQVNGALWDFSVSYSPVNGWAFQMTLVSGGSPSVPSSTVSWSAPFNGVSPFRSFNGLELFVVAGPSFPSNVASGVASATDLTFSAPGHSVTGSLANLVSSNGLIRQFVYADFDLSTTSWTLSGRLRHSFQYVQGQSSPGGNLDERLKFDLKAASVTLVPAPGGVALAAGVGVLAGRRRRR